MTRLPKEGLVALLAALLAASGHARAVGQAPLFPAPPTARVLAAPQPASAAAPASAAPRPTAVQIQAMSQRASQMAAKGMLYAARDELTGALRLAAEVIDAERRTGTHAAALAGGLTALAEAEDFAPPPGDPSPSIDVALVARSHRTPILKETQGLSPVVAQQHYLQFAREQLTAAVSPEPAASQALFTLGKVQAALAGPAAPAQSLAGPRAIVCYQAALAVDRSNYLAANELGVLLARYGQWQDARTALLHSVTVRPHAEGWHNLAIVHQRLGETDLARLAENERQLLAGRPGDKKPAGGPRIEWLEPARFAAEAGAERTITLERR